MAKAYREALKQIKHAKQIDATELDLISIKITDDDLAGLLSEISQIPTLTSLILSSQQLKQLPVEIDQLTT